MRPEERIAKKAKEWDLPLCYCLEKQAVEFEENGMPRSAAHCRMLADLAFRAQR